MKKNIYVFLFFISHALYSMQAINNEWQYSSAAYAAQQGEWEKAQQDYNTLLVNAPDNPSLLYDSGVASYRRKQFDQAAAYFNKVTELENIDKKLKERAHFNLGNTYVEQNKLEDAIKQYESVLQLNPDNESAKHNLEKVKEMLQQQQDKNKDQQQSQDKQQQQDQKQNKQSQQQDGNNKPDKKDKNKQENKNKDQQQKNEGQKDQQQNQQEQKSDNQQSKNEESNDQSGDSQNKKDKQKSSDGERDTQPNENQEQRDSKQDMPKDRGQEQQEQQQNAQSQTDQPDQKKTEQEKQQDVSSKHKQSSSEKHKSKQEKREPIKVTGKEDKKEEQETQGFAAQQQEEEPQNQYDRFISAVLKEQEHADAQANKRMIKQTIDKKLRGEHGQNRW